MNTSRSLAIPQKILRQLQRFKVTEFQTAWKHWAFQTFSDLNWAKHGRAVLQKRTLIMGVFAKCSPIRSIIIKQSDFQYQGEKWKIYAPRVITLSLGTFLYFGFAIIVEYVLHRVISTVELSFWTFRGKVLVGWSLIEFVWRLKRNSCFRSIWIDWDQSKMDHSH